MFPEIIPQKRCTKCGQVFPKTIEYFYWEKGGYFKANCKVCDRAKSAKYRQDHLEQTRQTVRDWRKVNQDYDRNRYDKNPVKKRAANKRWRDNNPLQAQVRHKRRKAIKKNAIGTYTVNDIQELYRDQEGRCAYCGISIYPDIPNDIHLDHVIPIVSGGSNHIDNLVLSCEFCNLSKKDRPLKKWLEIRGW